MAYLVLFLLLIILLFACVPLLFAFFNVFFFLQNFSGNLLLFLSKYLKNVR